MSDTHTDSKVEAIICFTKSMLTKQEYTATVDKVQLDLCSL